MQKVTLGFTQSGIPSFFTGHFQSMPLNFHRPPLDPDQAKAAAKRYDFEWVPTEQDKAFFTRARKWTDKVLATNPTFWD